MQSNFYTTIFSRRKIFQAVFFISTVLVILYFFPNEGKFRYHFQEGKPWKYGLLTAPFDFPIYKSDEHLKYEQDSVLKDYLPYFRLNPDISDKAISKFKASYAESLYQKMNKSLYSQTLKSLENIYKNGIVSLAEYEKLEKDQTKYIKILNKNISTRQDISQLHSPRDAYATVTNGSGSDFDKHILQSCDMNRFLTINLSYDSAVSQKVRLDLLQKISSSSGIVQTGERIIDRGEIVTPQTFLILKSLETVSVKKTISFDHQEATILGQIIVIVGLISFMYLYLGLFRPSIFNNMRQLLFILIMITGVTLLTFFMVDVRVLGIYMVPFAILPIIVRTFLDSRTALFAHMITVLLCSFVAPFALEFIFLQITVGMATIYSLRNLVKRSQLVRCAIFIFITYCFNYVGYSLLTEGNWEKINLNMFPYFAGNCASLLFAYLMIYLLEKIFGFTSDVTLVELSDINSPILRQMSEVCPGTFQHSLQVSNLAAEAANKIGANAQLVRTGALYHDIGKLNNPAFFTENQSGFNPHEKITYVQSAQIIIQHVRDGLKTADKLMLPQAIKDFISMHHGKSKTKYFYNSFKNNFPDYEINEADFTYPGPNPNSKETAILMMADSVEAASRSLKEYTEENIAQLVETIINTQMNEGLFKDTPISFRDLEKIKAVFIEKLKTMYHTRISYPELKRAE